MRETNDIERRLRQLRQGDKTLAMDLIRDGERHQNARLIKDILEWFYKEDDVATGRGHLLALHERMGDGLRREVIQRPADHALMRADIEDLLGGDWAYIPPGRFAMGTPTDSVFHNCFETLHLVQISRGFLMRTTPITQAEWMRVFGNNPSRFKGSEYDPEIYPVEQVTWYESVAYCLELSRSKRLETAYRTDDAYNLDLVGEISLQRRERGALSFEVDLIGLEAQGYRLPTEAEWEYACRAGTQTPFNDGLEINSKSYDDLSRVMDRLGWWGSDSTYPVARKKKNHWNLYDMHGLVRELCWDWYNQDSLEEVAQYDPLGPPNGRFRSRRGGSISDLPLQCRSANRGGFVSNGRSPDTGLRPVRYFCTLLV